MQEVLEREDKWAVDHDFALPTIDDLAREAEVHTDTVELASVYYDTVDHDLRAHGIVVRRREGDDDTGWQLKLPRDDGRVELRWPLSDTPPQELSRLLAGAALGKELSNAATIRTVRRRHRVVVEGDLRFEIADDTVRASTGTDLLAWREVEVELGPGISAVPKKLRRRLRAAGAKPSTYPSKLARATGMPTPAALPKAAAALTDYFNEQIDQIVVGDLDLRRGLDPIHDTRVAIRRLRSTLRVFKNVLNDAAAGLDSELKWFAALLGEVRDSQVQQRRFAEAVDGLPDHLVLGPVRPRIRSDLQALEFPARKTVDEAMESARYLDILIALRQWRTDPPIDASLAVKSLRERARKASRKAQRRLDQALDANDPALLHRARKAAKRARYAAELVAPLDPPAHRRRKQHKKVQSVLGDHQDTVVATAALRRLAIAAGTTAAENGFTYGLLYAREQRIADDCRAAAQALRRSLRRR
jgi:CHAD domain-containing protein